MFFYRKKIKIVFILPEGVFKGMPHWDMHVYARFPHNRFCRYSCEQNYSGSDWSDS